MLNEKMTFLFILVASEALLMPLDKTLIVFGNGWIVAGIVWGVWRYWKSEDEFITGFIHRIEASGQPDSDTLPGWKKAA